MSQTSDKNPPAITIVASPRSACLDAESADPPESEEDELLPITPPPALHMPLTSTLETEEQETLDEKLFDLYGDLLGEDTVEACRLTLEVAAATVTCESTSLFQGTLNDDHLTVVAATGPVADALIGRKMPFGAGTVGLCFDAALTMMIPDPSDSPDPFESVYSEGGVHRHAVLCVPILDDEGLVYGVIELLNPTSRSFLDEDEEAIEKIARVLGNALALG